MKHNLLSASLLMPLSSIASAQSADVSSGNFLYNPCKNAISDRNFSDYREVFDQGICAGRVAALLNVA
jgi:hypothetical protein